MTKLLYIPNGEYVVLNFNDWNVWTAEALLERLLQVNAIPITNEYFLVIRNLPLNHEFLKEEFELIYD